jgi:PAS domain S-box-containing protein
MDSLPPTKNHQVLIVVENKSIAQTIEAGLKLNGLQTILALDAVQAFAALKSQPVDLILFDLLPLNINVWEVSKKITEHHTTQSIPLIFFAESNASENIAIAFSYGGIDHVNISVGTEELITRVKFHLHMKSEKENSKKNQKNLSERNQELEAGNQRLSTLNEQLHWIVKQKNAELQNYLDAINVNIYSAITDLKGRILKVNEPLTTLTGYSEGELLGNNFSMFNSGHHPNSFFKDMWDYILSGKSWRGEVKNKRKDETYFWIDLVIIPLKDKDEEIRYFLNLALPITERKVNEETREKTIHVLETIAFSTSHKVRGPLATIQGLASLLQKDLIKDEEFRSVANQLVASSNELSMATSDMVKFVNEHKVSIQEASPESAQS